MSDKSCLNQSHVTQLHIYIIHMCDVLVTLSLSTFYIYISHNSTLNLFKNILVSTLSLIFTNQSYLILSGYDSQETLFLPQSLADLYQRIYKIKRHHLATNRYLANPNNHRRQLLLHSLSVEVQIKKHHVPFDR